MKDVDLRSLEARVAAHMTTTPVWSMAMRRFMRDNSFGSRPRTENPEVDTAMEMELLACGYTSDEIAELRALARKAAEAYRYAHVDKPVFYRPQARERGRCPFGHSRLYKKPHEVGPKKRAATIVYTPVRGYIRPFPEVKG